MLLTPRYDGPRVLQLDPPATGLATPLLRQRRRFAAVLATLDDRQWASESRCPGWSVQDVASHVAGTNVGWMESISAGLAGAPTRMFLAFDPASSPPRRVEAARGQPASQVLKRFVETTEALAEVVAEVDAAAWSRTGDSPLGHVGLDAVALHGLWDGWTHERDALLPLGMAPAEEPDEVAACLRYAAALGPALLATRGSTRRATLAVAAVDPEVSFVVEAGPVVTIRDGAAPPAAAPPDAVRLTGRAVDLVEALTHRAPLPTPLAAADRWLLDGVAQAFDLSS